MISVRGIAAGTLLVLLVGCLYTEPLTPPYDNLPPVFTSFQPQETDILLEGEGQLFQVQYTDPNEEDIPDLVFSWQLGRWYYGDGKAIRIPPTDLGAEGTEQLIATVEDPSGAKDILVWYLSVAPEVPGQSTP